MKTNFSTLRTSVYSTLGLFSILLTSCGTSQSTTYNDRDGIYGATANTEPARAASQGDQYKEYFGSLQENNEPDQIFTDVENYRSDDYENAQTTNENYDAGYGAWGSNPENVTVNVYDNSWGWGGWGWNNYWYSGYWGWNLGWGWNSWYGPAYYGWGFSPYAYNGWGYGGWYNYYPYGYGHGYYNNGYAYNGRRSSGYRNVVTTGGRNSYYSGTRARSNNWNNATRTRTGTRYSTYNTPRNNTSVRTPSNSNSRDYGTPRSNTRTQSQYNTPRNNSATRNYGNSTRNNSYTPSSSPSRSYSGSGGGNYGGGGRSGGGGRR